MPRCIGCRVNYSELLNTQIAPGSLASIVILVLFSSVVQSQQLPAIGAQVGTKLDVVFPVCHAVVDVTKPPYLAKGDGRTDDTDPIQRALNDVMGLHKIVYLPAGTYLVSKTLNWSNKNAAGKDAWGHNTVQGQNASKTIIRLKDATFTDARKPQSIMWCVGVRFGGLVSQLRSKRHV